MHQSKGSPAYRPDIDGMRAIAILSVIGFHASPTNVPGGFVGVDVFFVLSGYLISGIILRGLARGSFSFSDFYARRIRRIFPALIVMLVVSLSFGWVALVGDEYKQLGIHALAGAAFVSNFVFWDEAGYFDKAAELKPMLHLWSLGIEEQFYIFWPLFLSAAWKRSFSIIAVIVVIIVLSFTLNIWSTASHPDAAFYLPFPRFWELLAGAALAAASLNNNNRSNAFSSLSLYRHSCLKAYLPDIQATTGLLMLLSAIIGLSKDMSFPGWWVLMPVLGACLLISAGEEAWINKHVLSSRPIVFIGLISYPLYLWHWPLLSFARIIEGGDPAPIIKAVAIAMAGILACMTYWFVEKPIRFGYLALRFSLVPVLSVAISVIGISGWWIYKKDGMDSRIKTDLKNYKQLVNSPGEINDCKKSYAFAKNGYCIASPSSHMTRPIIYAIGDSHALAFASGLVSAIEQNLPDYSFLSIGKGGCPPFEGVERVDKEKYNCVPMNNSVMHVARSEAIHTVLIVGRWSTKIDSWLPAGFVGDEQATNDFVANWSGVQVDDDTEIFRVGLTNTLHALLAAGKPVYFVHQVPELGFNPRSCLERPLRISPGRTRNVCGVERDVVVKRQKRYRDIVYSILHELPSVKVFDPLDHLCDAKYCYAMINEKMLYSDDDHLSLDGAKYLSGKFIGTYKESSL